MIFMTADMIEEHHLKKVHVYEMKVSKLDYRNWFQYLYLLP